MNDDELDRAIAGLPKSTPPPEDLWPEIEARIQPSGSRWVLVAAAAAVLCAGWFLIAKPEAAVQEAPVVAAAPQAEPASPAPQTVPDVPEKTTPAVSPAEATLRAAADELTLAYSKRRRVLDEDLLAVFDDNLAVVDQAIDLSRTALRSSPEDEHLQRTLRQAYDHKLELLRTAANVGGPQ